MGIKSGQAFVPVVPAVVLALLVAVAGGAAVLYGIVLASGDPLEMHLANASVPALLGGACLWAGYRITRTRPDAVWTPLPWFLAAWTVYYGFGALAYVYATPETIAYMDAFYPVDDRALLRTNLLNLVGLVSVLAATGLVSRARLRSAVHSAHSPGHDPWRVAMLFLLVGVPVKYLFEFPYVLGLTDFVLPGSVQYLGTFSGLAILSLSVAAAQGRRGARQLLWLLIASEMLVGVVMLAKLHMIQTVLLFLLGRYAVRPDVKRLVIGGILIAIGYAAVLSPFVDFARIALGRASSQNLAEATDVAFTYGTKGRQMLAEVLPGVQGWWSRLAYSNTQAFAMDQYDQGKPGWTFAMAGYALVPRVLYEDKPIMTPGREFTYFAQGKDISSTGIGFFVAEAYWNGGWVLAILTGLFAGSVFAVLGRISLRAVRSGRWLYSPLVFMSIRIALRPDDWFVPAYLGGLAQVVVVVVFLNLVFARLVLERGRYPSRAKYQLLPTVVDVPFPGSRR